MAKVEKYQPKQKPIIHGDGWCFAIVNGRLAEIHFKKKVGIWAHSYHDRKSYKTKAEQKMIDADIKKYRFTYRDGYYYDKVRGVKQKAPSERQVFPELYDKKAKWYKWDGAKKFTEILNKTKK